MFVNDALVSSHASTKRAQAKITFTLQNWLKQSPFLGVCVCVCVGGGGGGDLKVSNWLNIISNWILLHIIGFGIENKNRLKYCSNDGQGSWLKY